MVGVRRRNKIFGVAPIAVRRSAHKTVPHVTSRARRCGMRTRKGEAGEARMIESCSLPLVHAMTVLAGSRNVVRAVIERPRGDVLLLVTADALRAEPDVYARRRASMTRIADQSRVRAQQREPIQVTANRAGGNLPSPDGMTILARRAHLAPMEIRMAISALLTDVTKDFFHMAGITRHVLVHASQRVLCLSIVIEFRSTANRRPTCCGVAIFAGNRQRSMRVSNTRGFVGLALQKRPKNQQAQCKNDTASRHNSAVSDANRMRIRLSYPACAV